MSASTQSARRRPGRGRGGAFARLHLGAIVLAACGAAAAAPWLWSHPAGAVGVAAALLVCLGIPHGAVDHRVARPLLAPRLGRLWFGAFALAYLGAAAVVLGGWFAFPAASLLAFLAVSTLHFGTEDAEGRGPAAMLARGGAPIALAILLHPGRTERFFGLLGGTEATFGALQVAAIAWVPVMAVLVVRLWRAGERGALAELAALALTFAALPPLMAFAFYFLVVHSPRHMAELAGRHAPDDAARGWAWAMGRAVPLSLATLAIGAALYWSMDGTAEARLLRTVFWGLAALTVPHMILHHLDRRLGGARLA